MKMRIVRLSLLLSAMAILAAACGSGSPAPQTNSTNEAVGSSPAPQSSGGVGLCDNPYVPVVKGSSFTRVYTSIVGVSTHTGTITAVRPDGFTVERIITQPDTTTVTVVENWSCVAEGLIQYPTSEIAAVVSGSSDTVTVNTISNQGVTIPRDVQPGDTWTQTFTVQVVSSSETMDWTFTYDFTAFAEEEVSVPVGNFTALKVQNHATMTTSTQTVEMDFTYWWARGVGLVKHIFMYGGEVLGSSELTAYIEQVP